MESQPDTQHWQDKIDDIQTDVKEIKSALKGDQYHKYGLIDKVAKQGRRLSVLEKIVYVGSGVILAIGLFLKLILPLFY